MKLSQIGEFNLIERIAAHERKHPETLVGIGDDAAVLKAHRPIGQKASMLYQLITTDALVQDVHFKLKGASFFDLGYKALAVNISDIAAMGGWPTHALVTVGLPKSLSVKAIDELYRGINQLAKKHKIDIIGGDTVASPKALMISITLLGMVEKENLLLRSTARVGDLICVTGKFGKPATKKFEISLKEARSIAKAKLANAMIDSSDGLVRSVMEICRASKVGARIWEKNVPIAKGANLNQALYGGEEYELVFTVSKKKVGNLTVVGEIVSSKLGIKLIDEHGRMKSLRSGGYEHFK